MSTSSSDETSRWTDLECAYPTSDGRPMGETDLHRMVICSLIDVLQAYYADERTYVSGNLLLFYRRGNRRRHVSPDVLVVRDHDPRIRENYLLWEEGRSPNIVIEVTSKSTRHEDLHQKFRLYRDEIGVAEYVLFDPRGEYLKPSLQGYRLHDGRYEPIEMVDNRLPSVELGLSFERRGEFLRVYDPVRRSWLLTYREIARREERRRHREEQRRLDAESQRQEEEQRRRAAEEQSRLDREELERMRCLIAKLQGLDGKP